MAAPDLLQIAICLALIMLLAVPLSRYLSAVYQGRARWLAPVERGFYRLCGIDPQADQHWTRYAAAMLVLNGAGLLLLYAVLRLQGYLPLNPQHVPGVSPALAFNTAVSFTSNTNWQAYGGETTMSYFSQMLGLTVQNFLSAGTGMAVAVAVIRGFSRRSADGIGNFYVDLTRSILYVLLPLALIGALFLAWQGVPQNFHHYVQAATLNGGHQTLAQGPAASQVAIKQLGTNGGGFFNVNSAHPYENPTPLTNLLETVFILLIPVAMVLAFGRLVGDRRQGWALFAAMAVMFLIGLSVLYASEHAGNPALAQLPVDTSAGNMVGKEVRIGVGNSALWAAATTAASNGSVNAMMDSLTPLGGLAALANILTGEVVFGGVGTGLYGMILFVVITVFLAGLMVGRTPEYLGKKIESREVTLSLLALLTMPVGVIGLGALAASLPAGVAGISATGPHGLSQLIYAYASATGNNGSAFAGLQADSFFNNTLLGLAMLLGRYGVIIPMLGVAGGLAAKKAVPPSAGTFPTHGPLFVGLLIGVVLIVGGLTFFPTLALGPIAEHLALAAH